MTCQHLGMKTVLEVYEDHRGTEQRLMDGESITVEKHTVKVYCHECKVTYLEEMLFPISD